MGDHAVRFERVSKRFRLGEYHDSLRDVLASSLSRLWGQTRRDKSNDTLWALRNVTFAATRGEALGIIGPNGAGKSTALKLLARILRPDEGRVRVQGRLAALIEVGAGFHGDLSGRENIYLNGAILGMSRAEIRQKLDAIVAFAGLERFLDTPVKRYSSGMYARLGFSIAAHVEPDVLLVDEVLSVGDAVFRMRCLEQMRRLLAAGTTLVFVTHQLEQMQSICRRAIVLQEGAVAFEGAARDAVGHYVRALAHAGVERATDLATAGGAVEVAGLRFLDENDRELSCARSGAALRIELRLVARRDLRRLVVELNLRSAAGELLLSLNSGRGGFECQAPAGESVIDMTLPGLPVSGGQYFWNVRAWDAERASTELDTPFAFPLVVDDGGRGTGPVYAEPAWAMRVSDERTLPCGTFALTPAGAL